MSDERSHELAARLAAVRSRIDEAAQTVGRNPAEIALLPVTKFHPAADVARLVALGYPEVGENREQEGREKAQQVPAAQIHLIGQIQTKKANSVARWAWGVSSLDSLRLADALDHGMELAMERGDRLIAGERASILPCLVQLSFDGDPHRGGISQQDAAALVERVEKLARLRFDGFMCVPPLGSDPAEVFAWAQELTATTSVQLGRPLELSAGMSSDLEQAIAHGSTIVRVGTDILGSRPVA